MPVPSFVLAAAVMNAALPHAHVALTFETASLPAAIVRAAIEEAAAVWSPYNVVVDQALPCASAPEEATVITVAMRASSAVAARDRRGPLGAIDFDDDGTPDRLVTVYFDLLRRLMTYVRSGPAPEDQWPSAMRDHVLGRGMGRVIAHEIGHYLLGAHSHRSFGLMRALQHTDELFAVPRAGFRLSDTDVRRLARSSIR